MIDTIIFDLGKVLVKFDPEKGMRKLEFSQEAIDIFKAKIFAGLWEKCDRAQYNDAEIRALFKGVVPGFEKEVDMLWDNLPVVTGVLPHSDEWLRTLKDKGYKLYVLSNYGKRSFEINSKTYDFLKYMDGGVISYEVMRVKPEPEIYDILIEKYNINPAKAVFIDDRAVNIDAAIEKGFSGIVFETYEQASQELELILENEFVH